MENTWHKKGQLTFLSYDTCNYTHLYTLLCFIFNMCVEQICIWNIIKDDKYICIYYVGTMTRNTANWTYHQLRYTSRTLQCFWPRWICQHPVTKNVMSLGYMTWNVEDNKCQCFDVMWFNCCLHADVFSYIFTFTRGRPYGCVCV